MRTKSCRGVAEMRVGEEALASSRELQDGGRNGGEGRSSCEL